METIEATEAPPRRQRHAYWLLSSIPLALLLDVGFACLARFWWCGFGICFYRSGDFGAIGWITAAGVVTFLAVALPPWIPGWRRATVASAAAVAAALTAALFAFSVF